MAWWCDRAGAICPEAGDPCLFRGARGADGAAEVLHFIESGSVSGAVEGGRAIGAELAG